MARFVLLPQDDLNLACLLKSPLVGLDEDKLFTLAWKRKGHLWRALRDRAREPDVRRRARAAVALAGARRLHHAVRFLRPGARPRGRPPAHCSSGWAARPPIRSTSCWRARCSTSAPRRARCRASCAGSRRAAARSSATSTPTAGRRCASSRCTPRRACRRRSSTCPTPRACRATASACWPRPTARRGCGCRAATMPTRPPAPGAPRRASARWRSRTACSTSP